MQIIYKKVEFVENFSLNQKNIKKLLYLLKLFENIQLLFSYEQIKLTIRLFLYQCMYKSV